MIWIFVLDDKPYDAFVANVELTGFSNATAFEKSELSDLLGLYQTPAYLGFAVVISISVFGIILVIYIKLAYGI